MFAWYREHSFFDKTRPDDAFSFQHLHELLARSCEVHDSALQSLEFLLNNGNTSSSESKKCFEIAVETIEAWGHENVRATHRTTFEITKEESLTPRGDCIIGVRASKSVAELNSEFKNVLRRDSTILVIVLEAGGFKDVVLARGSAMLQLSDNRKVIVRRSRYVEGATLAIEANKAARDLSRRLISALREPSTKLTVRLVAIDLSSAV